MAAPGSASQPQPEAGLKERFFRHFQQEVSAIQDRITRLNTTTGSGDELARNKAIDECLEAIDRISHEVKDASSYLPPYDRRTYGDTIKSLSEKLQGVRNVLAPPKKFQFRTARKNISPAPLVGVTQQTKENNAQPSAGGHAGSNAASSVTPLPLSKPSSVEERGDMNASSPNAGSVDVSNHSNAHVLLPASALHIASSGTVFNITHSVVDLSQPTTGANPLAGLILKNIKSSLVVCGHVSGPAHITGVEDSVLVVACRQLRMHSSKNVQVYLYSSSRPIIEDCVDIHFAPLPDTYVTSEMNASSNQWDQIDDFKWLKLEPSPHFTLLSPSDRIKEEVWESIVLRRHTPSVDHTLEAVGVPRKGPMIPSGGPDEADPLPGE